MKSDDEEKSSNRNKVNKTKTNKINIKTTKTNLLCNSSLWNQNRYQGGTWIKPKSQQSLSHRIVDKIPNFNPIPPTIQTSLSSSISSLTKERKIKKEKKKVDQFLNKWKNKKHKKTITQQSFPQQSNDELTISQNSKDSNTQSLFTIKTLNSHYINQCSNSSSQTTVTRK